MAALTPPRAAGRLVDIAEEALPPGSVLDGGRYRVGSPLGRGGFGITYEADDLRLRRPVAIKELFPDRARRDGASVVVPGGAAEGFTRARQRFLREATTLARFGHPAIVRIFAVFEEHGTAYLVLERLDGQTLAEELAGRRGPFTEAEALDVAAQVAAALSIVHRAGVLHRDVSPANLVRTTDGRVVLIDFGLARPFADDRTTAMTRIVTPGYAPPEQHEGVARFSARADVYALGATLHRLLSGRVPPAAGARERGASPEALWRVNPTVSRRVSDAVGRALALEPRDRPPTVGDLLDLLGVPTDDLDLRDLPPAAPAPDELATIEAALAAPAVVADDGGPDGAGPEGATRAADDPSPATEPAGAAGDQGPDGGDPDRGTVLVGPAEDPGPGPVPDWSVAAGDAHLAPEATPARPGGRTQGPSRPSADRPTTAWSPPEPDAAGARPRIRPASHVVPAPPPQGRRPGVPGGSPLAPLVGPTPDRMAGPTGGPPRGRAWVTLPLGLAGTALASAQPATVTLVIGLVVAPVLATVGDHLQRPDRHPGWAVGWWARNLLIGLVRALAPLVLLAFGLLLWYGTEAFDGLAAAGPWVLRATGVAAGGVMCLSVGQGGTGFRSHLALDALARRLLPAGRPTLPAAVLVLVCVALAAAGLWFQPEAWPLGG